jgi:hypothetical protein
MEESGRLLSESVAQHAPPKWKVGVWEADQVVPALLRPPPIIIFFLLLWAVNVYIYERNRLSYVSVLPGMKNISIHFLFVSPLVLLSAFAATWYHLYDDAAAAADDDNDVCPQPRPYCTSDLPRPPTIDNHLPTTP